MNIVLATRNKKKIEEIRKILSDVISEEDIRIFTPDDLPECPEVEEDGDTFEANAIKKAMSIAKCSHMIAVADDSGLEVEALNSAPGVFSARYAGENTDDRANCEKLLLEMKDIPPARRAARFVCCIALASGESVQTFMGYAKGTIGTEMRGKMGFGYDPLFFPEGSDRTFAEMSDHEKNAISHRAKALALLQKFFKEKRLVS